MRITRTLSLYVVRETALHCVVAFSLLSLVLLTHNLLRRLDDLFLEGITFEDLQIVLACILPIVVSYALPPAFLVRLMLALRRMGSDGEIQGFRAGGLGPGSLLVPLLLMGALTAGVSAWLLNSVEHESRRDLVKLFKNVAARGAILEPGKFRHIGSRLIFVEERNRAGELRGVMIVDESQPEQGYRIFASQGRFRFEPETAEILIELFRGDVHLHPSDDDPRRYERIRFDEFAYRVGVGHILGGDFGPVRPKQMNLAELREVIERARRGDALRELDQRDPREYELEIQRRRALPFAPLIFAGIGVPIALASERRGRNRGLLLCLIAAFGYYALSALMEIAARSEWLPPALASWIPNLLFTALALGLIVSQQNRVPA